MVLSTRDHPSDSQVGPSTRHSRHSRHYVGSPRSDTSQPRSVLPLRLGYRFGSSEWEGLDLDSEPDSCLERLNSKVGRVGNRKMRGERFRSGKGVLRTSCGTQD